MRRCSRRKFQPTFISSTASIALRPRHGAFPLWAASPWNSVLDRDEAVAGAVSPTGREIGADVVVEDDVHVLEESRAHVVRLGREQFLGDARPQHERSRKLVPLHDALDGNRGDDVERHAGVVTLAMPGSAVDDRGAIRHARLLRRLRNAVDIGAQCNDRFAGPEARRPCRRNAGDTPLNREALALQDGGQVALCLVLLETNLTEAEDRVHHLLREVVHAVDARRRLLLVLRELRRH